MKRSEKDLFDDDYAIFSYFLYKGTCCGYSLNCIDKSMHQMSTHNICLYKEEDKKYTGCNLKTTEFHDCVLLGVYAVIRLNTVRKNIYLIRVLFRHLQECGFMIYS